MTSRSFSRFLHGALPFIWVPLILIYLHHEYSEATFMDAHVAVVEEPYLESPTLNYVWSGDVNQSCAIVIDREIITSEGVIVTLKSSPVLPPLPLTDLGPRHIPLSIEIPTGIPEGPTIYQATERPRCNWLQRISPPRIPYPPVRFNITH